MAKASSIRAICLSGKGPVGRHVRPGGRGGGARAGCRGSGGLGLFPRSLGRGLLASLDGDPGGREDQDRGDGDQRFQSCKPHHLDHSFGKSGDRHRHCAGRGRTRHEPGQMLDERRGHCGRSFAGHLGPERRGGRSEPAPHQAVTQPLPPAGQAALDRTDRAAEPVPASS